MAGRRGGGREPRDRTRPGCGGDPPRSRPPAARGRGPRRRSKHGEPPARGPGDRHRGHLRAFRRRRRSPTAVPRDPDRQRPVGRHRPDGQCAKGRRATRDGARRARGCPARAGCRDASVVPGRGPGRPRGGVRKDQAAAGGRLRRVPRQDRCNRDAPSRLAGDPSGYRNDRTNPRGLPPHRCGRHRPLDTGTGGWARCRGADRAPGSCRSGSRQRLHDRRREPRRRDQWLEHRDRRVHARCVGRRAAAAAAGRPHRDCDCRLRGLRGAVPVRGPRRRDGGGGAARPRARPTGHGGGGSGLGRHWTAVDRAGVGVRRGLPPVGPGDRGNHRVGLTVDGSPGRRRAFAAAPLGGRDPRCLVRRPGGDDTSGALHVRAALAGRPAREPARRADGAAGDGDRCARARGRHDGRRGRSAGRGDDRRAAGMGPVRGDGRRGPDRRWAAAGEPRAGRPVGRPHGGHLRAADLRSRKVRRSMDHVSPIGRAPPSATSWTNGAGGFACSTRRAERAPCEPRLREAPGPGSTEIRSRGADCNRSAGARHERVMSRACPPARWARPDRGPGRWTGGRDPRRRGSRRSARPGWRTRPVAVADCTRRTSATVGSPHRHPGAEPSARGPRGGTHPPSPTL